MAQAALANTMGLTWEESVRPAAGEIPFAPYPGKLETLVGSTYQFSPDWASWMPGCGGPRARSGRQKAATTPNSR